ncbi:hypothetical protein R83H12_02531 [Fibrobacteria bacterium R8-3-H12]
MLLLRILLPLTLSLPCVAIKSAAPHKLAKTKAKMAIFLNMLEFPVKKHCVNHLQTIWIIASYRRVVKTYGS